MDPADKPASSTLDLAHPGPDAILAVWSKTIELQMHFNLMCMQLRRTAIGMLGGLLGAGALAFRFGGYVTIGGRGVSSALVFVLVALLIWLAFYVLDRFWYHELLRATVRYAEGLSVPAQAAGLTVPLDMSARIKAANRRSLGMSGGAKVSFFYGLVALALAGAAWALYVGLVAPVPAGG